MLKRGLLVIALVVLIMSVAACGGKNAPSPSPSPGVQQSPAATNAGENTEAMAIYKGNCMACHATDLAGSGSFPSLQKVGSKYSESEISQIVNNGKGGMPAFKSKLSEQEITTLSKWLSEKK